MRSIGQKKRIVPIIISRKVGDYILATADDWKEDYSERFDELRKNRVQLSRLKYGRAKKNFQTGNVDAIETMKRCVKKYQKTGNTEYLVDAANYLMFEFMYPQVLGAFFKPTDSDQSAGVVGITEKEMEELKNQDY